MTINHNPVKAFHGRTVIEECHAMVVEFMENGSLFSVLHPNLESHQVHQLKSQLDDKLKTRWLRDAASGIEYLHRHVRIQRDIKSENILINAALVAKIADFGTSRPIRDRSEGFTTEAQAHGQKSKDRTLRPIRAETGGPKMKIL